jgi:helix-turn-helix protein
VEQHANILASLPADQTLLTAPEAARIAKISPRLVYKYSEGHPPKLSYVRFGRAKRFILSDLLRFIEKQTVKSRRDRRSGEAA